MRNHFKIHYISWCEMKYDNIIECIEFIKNDSKPEIYDVRGIIRHKFPKIMVIIYLIKGLDNH
jgi:hypothetical protein